MVVTGGASGIGKVLVETLMMMRVTVVVIDRDEMTGILGKWMLDIMIECASLIT